jgi:hypothetical protein
MKLAGAIFVLCGVLGGAYWYLTYDQKPSLPAGAPQPLTFVECARYFPVKESRPRSCTNGAGTTMVEDLGNSVALEKEIELTSPRPNDTITSPVKIHGQALGSWYNGSTIEVLVLDIYKNEIARGEANTASYTNQIKFAPFDGAVTFTKPVFGTTGSVVILNKSDDNVYLEIPVTFE